MKNRSIAIVSHNYFHPQWQEKLPFLLGAFSRLVILQPHLHKSIEKKYRLDFHPSVLNNDIKFYSFYAIFIESVTFCTFLNPLKFLWILIQEAPSVILLEEDPHSSIGMLVLLSLLFLKALRIDTKLVLFTWDNLNRKPSNSLAAFLKILATRLASKYCSGLIAGNSDALKLAHGSKGFVCHGSILPLLAVPSQPSMCSPRLFPKHRFRIGYIGRLVPEKGISTLFDACDLLAKTHDIELIIVGSGPFLDYYQNYVPGSPQWLSFVGYVPFEQVYDHLSLIDLLVLPSIDTVSWKEQFGLVLAQAMSVGVPCVGSDSGAIPDVINDSSLIFGQGNSYLLFVILQRLILRPDLYERASLAALERANMCFSASSVGNSYANFLKSVLAGNIEFIQKGPYNPIHIY